MKTETVHREATELMANHKVATRIEEIQRPIRERAEITLESHLERLKHLSNMAETAEQYSAAIKAEESRGKASGLYVDKKEVDVNLSVMSEILSDIEETDGLPEAKD
jgi:uncharacterized protein YecA (UPF0149 family)